MKSEYIRAANLLFFTELCVYLSLNLRIIRISIGFRFLVKNLEMRIKNIIFAHK